MTRKDNHYSYYRLEFYHRCPFFYFSNYKQKIPKEDSEPMIDGRATHDIIRAYTLACFKAKKSNLFKQWKKIADPVLRRHHLGPQQEDRILEDTKAYLEAHEIELKDLAGVEEEIALDRDLKPCKWENGFFRGKIDRLYLRRPYCKISDYKTGYSMTADRFQNETYAWGISKYYPAIQEFELEIDYTRFDYQDTWKITKKDLPDIERKILNQIARIEADTKFEPRIGSQCVECPFWHACPAMKQNKTLERLIPKNQKNASMLLQEIVSRQKQLKEMRAILDHYVEDHGQVISNDMQAVIRANKRTRWDVEGLIEWAHRENIPILDALTVDNRKLERIIKPGQAPKNLYQIKLETEVLIKKIKAEKEKRKR